MLDTDTKRRIDTARDILVGKVPDPKSQVEQITIALIYKFMDDMDKESESLGGKPTFFKNGYAKYSWSRIFDPKLGGHELIALYGQAIVEMNQNKNIPQLFRDIFKNAYLPYRDPETLKSFLKTINDFHYDHSEKLGDAFEYLLSIMDSQGDAGQFRTPRHIIDFIVSVVEPKKNETVLDPACGTAGFLISAYKRIIKENTKDNKITLTPDEKKRLVNNFIGYDISPDMVRLSLVNMYLHGFKNPKIYEYDTLTSEDRWNDKFDVIMANPPFMTPKGGIKPHKRFSVQANRSEVLFVDYIVEHLNPTGRAGIIVPEGIIFQSSNAYKALRKMLIENYLYAVVSLPAGVFNPYSGVKTSILLMDKNLAKKAKDVLFVKVENDGYGLGAQRREVEQNDLPEALKIIESYKQLILKGKADKLIDEKRKMTSVVSKQKLLEDGDYNLSAHRYIETVVNKNHKWSMVEIGSICELVNGRPFKPEDWEKEEKGGLPIIRIQNLNDKNAKFNYYSKKVDDKLIINHNDLLFSWSGSKGTSFGPHIWSCGKAILNQHIFKVNHSDKYDRYFLYLVLKKIVVEVENNLHGGVGLVHITKGNLERIKIPLPPIEVQQKIVEEIEGYQKIIDGARQVVENYKPSIKIDPEWEILNFGNEQVFEIIDGDRGDNYPSKDEFKSIGHCIFLNTKNVTYEGFNFNEIDFISEQRDGKLRKGKLKRNDVVLTTRGTVGNSSLYDKLIPYEHIRINSGMVILRPNINKILPEYLWKLIQSIQVQEQFKRILSGTAQPQLPIKSMITAKYALPPIETQKQIVAQIEEEQNAVDSSKKLIELFEQKIKDKISEVWESKK